MSVLPFYRSRQLSALGEMMREIERIERHFMPISQRWEPFQEVNSEMTNIDEKFAVNLNVSNFKPEELKIDLEGRTLSIQGEQEVKNENGYSKKSFSRVILLPEDVDVAAVSSNLTEDGRLSIEAPKREVIRGRSIPIQQISVEKKPAD